MSANGISTLSTKEERQRAKLDLAASNRAGDNNIRSTYDLTLLPTQYDSNTVINNPNIGGLVTGRPWINAVEDFVFYEAFGTTLAITTTQYVSGNKIYVYSSTYDVPAYQNAVLVVNDIQVLDTALRGHSMVVLDSNGNALSITNYDTYDGNLDQGAAARSALASALNAVASGNIVVLTVYDASSLDSNIRTILNNTYGSTNTNTWTSSRVGHIFIGIKP
jgi:hypothetical protein